MREEFSVKANFVCCRISITGFVLCFYISCRVTKKCLENVRLRNRLEDQNLAVNSQLAKCASW